MERPKWLTREFVRKVFGEDGGIEECQLEMAAPPEDNYCSDIYRVTFRNQSFVVKSKPSGSMSSFVEDMSMFEKETEMYNFLEEVERLVGAKLGPRRIPFEDLIVMEDLKRCGYTVEDRRLQLGLEHSLSALRTVAKLHAASAVLLRKHPAKYQLLRKELFFTPGSKSKEVGKILIRSMARESSNWPQVSKYSKRLEDFVDVAFENTRKEIENSRNLRVIVHGDLHTNNIMFNKDKLDRPLMVDFQFVREASPAMDTIYFILTSVRPETRRRHRTQLLQAYIDSFNSTMETLQADYRLTMDQLEEEIYSMRTFGFYIVSTRTALVLYDSSEEFKETFDLVKCSPDLYKNESYINIAINYIEEFAQLGVF